jgi:serine/threonine protein kinase
VNNLMTSLPLRCRAVSLSAARDSIGRVEVGLYPADRGVPDEGNDRRAAMAETWAKWESLVINGVFPLRRFLSRSNHSVVFLTEHKALMHADAAIKLIPAHPTRAEAQLSHWRTVAGFSHPHLIRLFDSGSCQIAGHPFLFVVMEYAEQTLAQLLPRRPLSPDEARDMLSPMLDALAFIHGKGMVHRKLKPPNVLVVNDQLKLASDTVQPAGDPRPRGTKLCVYDPPEAKDGKFSAPGDVWALGITLVEALTQCAPAWPDRRPDTLALPADFPSPLADTARRCLSHDPAERPTVLDLIARAKSPAENAASLAPQHIAPPGAGNPVVELPAIEVPAEKPSNPPPDLLRRHSSVLTIGIIAISLAAIWAASRLLHGHHTAQSAASGASSQSIAPTGAPDSPTAATAGATTSVLHKVIPDISEGTRATIHGRIKVAVLLTVDPSGSVTDTTLKDRGSSRYFARLATDAGRQWMFIRANNPAPRKWLLHFEFTRDGATGYADGPQQ